MRTPHHPFPILRLFLPKLQNTCIFPQEAVPAPISGRRDLTLPESFPRDTLMVSFCGASGKTDMVVFFSERKQLLAFTPALFSSSTLSGPITQFYPLHPTSLTALPQGPRFPGLVLTGNTELFSLLHSQTSSREGHLTGEVGAVVLGPGCEVQL